MNNKFDGFSACRFAVRFVMAVAITSLFCSSRSFAAADSLGRRPGPELPLTFAIDFRNFSLPLRDVSAWFSHPGIQVGTEVNWNRSHTLVQQAAIGYGLNREMGNSFIVYTQLGYRHRIFRGISTQIAFGAGWQRAASPAAVWEFSNNRWEKSIGAKSMVILPLSLSFYYRYNTVARLEPFVSLSAIPVLFYNEALPLSFSNSLQFGVKIHRRNFVL